MNKLAMWIIGIIITIAAGVMGYSIQRVDNLQTVVNSAQAEMNKTFLSKEQYRVDQSELCGTLDRLGEKIDRNDKRSETRSQKIMELLLQHERDSVKRDKVR